MYMATTKNKEILGQHIKNWLQVDKELQLLQKELKERKKKKNDISAALLQIMKTNEIDCFDINDGKIIYSKNNVKKALNKDHLINCLDKYFVDNPAMKTDEIVKFIMETREVSTKESIRHKPLKNV
jgi:hypothetical protein